MNKNAKELNKSLTPIRIMTLLIFIVTLANTVISFRSFILWENTRDLKVALYALFSTAIMALLFWIFQDIKKEHTPFIKSVIIKLQALGILVVIASYAPTVISAFAAGVESINGVLTACMENSEAMFIFLIGFIISIVAIIFNYGAKLQEDVDSIA